MATLAFSLAGQVVGGLVGGPIGATIGRALGALAGAAIDSTIFGEKPAPQAPVELRLQGSIEGGAIPRLYGWSRVSGNIIWATELEELSDEDSGAKGAPQGEETLIAASFALALCEGEVQRLGRIWADGQPLDTAGLMLRFYRGTEDQGVDSLIEAKQGSGAAPAYRGLCYLVFERLPLKQFGNRIPNLSVELCRVVGELEPAIRAVTVIPGATEFGYDPTPRVRLLGPGMTGSENTHLSSSVSDWTLSIDELTALCPNLEHVALVVAWFGTDLRCGECLIRPQVEHATRLLAGASWSVAGLTRASASVVSSHAGGPAYGGTPSDSAVLAAIADLKARGLKVTLYPIVMMDIAAGNSLPNPYGGPAGQAPYPWRGRITCMPAPGQSGTPDKTSAVAAQVSAFVGTGSDWRFRRMIRHYANLAVSAGGVDAFIIGSELRGMSFLRNATDGFPFVDALVALAAEVRGIVGAGTRLTYAADWSEFSGLQPPDAPGDKYFHLDPLWVSANIDAVGIDNYMPLADWRDGTDHADWQTADGPYDQDYLRANIAGGEGFDWYYGSDADRIAGVRTPIADAAHGEPWVWRFKDLADWWSHSHHNRVGGVRSASPTAWLPASKPIWFTELGCAAIDKGANQPNVFGDAKSSENARPYFSDGGPDSLAQRQVLRAHLNHWNDSAGNPVSPVYGAPMVDPDRIYLWTWDARPYPAFPANLETWSDGVNHETGHWLTGRLGALAGDELLKAVAADYGTSLYSVDAVPPLVHGLVIEGVISWRDATSPVIGATQLAIKDGTDGVSAVLPKERLARSIEIGDIVAAERAQTSLRRPDPTAAIRQVSVTYADRERGYLTGTVTAVRPGDGGVAAQHLGVVLDASGGRLIAEGLLAATDGARETLGLSLPPSALALEAGDVVNLAGQADNYTIVEVKDRDARLVTARLLLDPVAVTVTSDRPNGLPLVPPAFSVPLTVVAHLPPDPAEPGASRLAMAAWASPWPGRVTFADDTTLADLAVLSRGAHLGELVDAIGAGQSAHWDDVAPLTVKLYSGHLSSREEASVLAGTNRLMVLTDAGQWEVIAFASAELVGPATYRLTRLLRGQAGTDYAIGPAASRQRVVVVNDRLASRAVPSEWLGEVLSLRTFAGRTDPAGTALPVPIETDPILPLSPVHLRAVRAPGSNDVLLSWTRRSRADDNAWGTSDAPLEHAPEAYRLTILNGGTAVRSFAPAAPSAVYSGADQIADFGAVPASFGFTVAQVSAVHGPGHSAQGVFNA